MDTGCPAQELLVTVIITSGMCSRPFSLSRRSRAVMFMLPLKSFTSEGIRASFTGRSTASAPLTSMLARVVSKWVLLGMTFPLPPMISKRIFSAARPWWVGMMCLKPVKSFTTFSNR